MTETPKREDLADATARLQPTIDALSDTEIAGPSLLPGWTRAHLLTHLARNADAMRNFLLAARSGTHVPMYASRPMRDADIDTGSRRPPELIRLDAEAAASRLALDLGLVERDPDGAALWSAPVMFASGAADGPVVTLADTVWFRLREVEIHHVDLDAGYTFARTPTDLAVALTDDIVRRLGSTDLAVELADDEGRTWSLGDSGPTVRGSLPELLAWLLGRDRGGSLRVEEGALPTVPSAG